jgi:hypothetical protein
MTGIAGCCAHATNGHAAAAPPKRADEFSPPDVDCHVTLPWGSHADAMEGRISRFNRAVCGYFTPEGGRSLEPIFNFDHLVGGREQDRRHGEAERPGGLEIDGKFKFGRILNASRIRGALPGADIRRRFYRQG